eukprot:787469_1
MAGGTPYKTIHNWGRMYGSSNLSAAMQDSDAIVPYLLGLSAIALQGGIIVTICIMFIISFLVARGLVYLSCPKHWCGISWRLGVLMASIGAICVITFCITGFVANDALTNEIIDPPDSLLDHILYLFDSVIHIFSSTLSLATDIAAEIVGNVTAVFIANRDIIEPIINTNSSPIITVINDFTNVTRTVTYIDPSTGDIIKFLFNIDTSAILDNLIFDVTNQTIAVFESFDNTLHLIQTKCADVEQSLSTQFRDASVKLSKFDDTLDQVYAPVREFITETWRSGEQFRRKTNIAFFFFPLLCAVCTILYVVKRKPHFCSTVFGCFCGSFFTVFMVIVWLT